MIDWIFFTTNKVIIVLILYFIMALLFGISPKLPIAMGIGLIVLAALFSALNVYLISVESISVFAFFFFAVGVVLKLVEPLTRDKNSLFSLLFNKLKRRKVDRLLVKLDQSLKKQDED